MWTSPISFSYGFHYYVIFVDHFTKYIRLNPLRHKSDIHSTFVTFKKLVENYFTTTIKTLYYIDNGGELLVLWSFLATHGTTHLSTPLHTPEHNRYSKRRHRHIVETGLTLLHHASIPLTFRPYAFATGVYLINHMPKVSISLGSSFEKLFHKAPLTSVIYVFPGCVSTLPTNSTPNLVSVSFSATPNLKKIFMSCHFNFVENFFLFSPPHHPLHQ